MARRISARSSAETLTTRQVFGSPATWIYHATATAGDFPICRPLTWPMTPYFISTLDPNWRDFALGLTFWVGYTIAKNTSTATGMASAQ